MKWPWYYYVGIGALAVGVFALLIVSAGKVDLRNFLEDEKEIIDEKVAMRKLEASVGHEQATEIIKEKHRETIEKLDHKEARRILELQRNPVALSTALLRAGKRKPKYTV